MARYKGNPHYHQMALKDNRRRYPDEWKMSDIFTQARRLQEGIWGFEPKFRSNVSTLLIPQAADGIALIPTLLSLGRLWGIDMPYDNGYAELAVKSLGALSLQQNSHSFWWRKLSPENIRLEHKALEIIWSLEEDADRQGFTCLTIPISFGEEFSCCSALFAHWQAIQFGNLPLATPQVACMLISMPDRMTNYLHQGLICAGDEVKSRDRLWTQRIEFQFFHDVCWNTLSFDHFSIKRGVPVAFPENYIIM
jgi:hypothetical protein